MVGWVNRERLLHLGVLQYRVGSGVLVSEAEDIRVEADYQAVDRDSGVEVAHMIKIQ
jgi:hypothetical protein